MKNSHCVRGLATQEDSAEHPHLTGVTVAARHRVLAVLICLGVMSGLGSTPAYAGFCRFARQTDTILIPGHTFPSHAMTMEAMVKFASHV